MPNPHGPEEKVSILVVMERTHRLHDTDPLDGTD